jgi:toxin ParE1/3/4
VARLVWSEPALDDLDKIAEYLALDNLPAAKSMVQMVFETVDRLKDFPESGRRPPELARSRYREVISGPCRVFYRIDGNNVFILHVMRSERKLRNLLLRGRDRSGS